MANAHTVGDLRARGWQRKSVKQELRDNLIARLRKGDSFLPGIVGYDDTVVPQIENAILAGQDMIFLGERGQAKTRIARLLVGLLDEEIPVLAGCEINDDPLAPICAGCRQRLAEQGDKAAIEWIPRDRRYGEKLATPDITIADLIGEVDPIKVAEGRYLGDELTIHYGLLPRTHRGIFSLNELPDLAERIQVGLLNIMEERDVQIRGYKVRLPLTVFGDGVATQCPDYMKQIVAELTHLARQSSDVSQRSGVSVRVSICNYENILASALKRAIRLREEIAVPRVSDLGALAASTVGKIELESVGDGNEEKLLGRLVQKAVHNVFGRRFGQPELDEVVAAFKAGASLHVSDAMPSDEYVKQLGQFPALRGAVVKLGATEAAAVASAVEFVLEGLHLAKKLNKDVQPGRSRYRS
ncbi:MAG: magnesium chelatase [Candidatus Rokuibacteriota bacterium]|nr:MAG: magnesium chelatase [Candidatus Rokubacteria bacterium]